MMNEECGTKKSAAGVKPSFFIHHSSFMQEGFTLIELLLYVAILGSLLFAVSQYFVTTASARVKNQSIFEVEQQGVQAMEYITRTVRNADSITSPTAGTTGSSLTLTVPTGALSPTIFSADTTGATVLGYDQDAGFTDGSNSNFMNSAKFTASATGTISALYARVASVAASPNNQAQMAIYSGASSPSALLASSESTTLTADSWTAFSISPVKVTSGQVYWLVYNTNGLAAGDNNLRYHGGTTSQSRFVAQTFGTWPGSWTGTTQDIEFSMYAVINTATSTGALQVQEGAASPVVLTNSKVQISGLSFTNLTRSGTPGVVRVSFTLSRLNASGRNEYEYQKTFTATAALRP